MSKVSIIIPVYNCDTVLSRCLESILQQVYIDFEVLLINDGSTDMTPQICEEFSKRDHRIRTYHKTNGGVSSARNLGLKYATGKYITFVDGDDWIGPFYISNLLSHIAKDVDLVISYNWYITSEKQEQEHYPSCKIDAETFQLMFSKNDLHYHTSPWGKLYRKRILEKYNLNFDEGMHIGEDLLFLYNYMLVSKQIVISSDTDYFYVADMPESLTKRVNKVEDELHSYKRVYSIIDRLITERNIVDKQALNSLGWVLGTYTRRVLNALYYNQTSKKRRFKIMCSIDIDTYLKHVKTSSWKEVVYKIILKMKFYFLYDYIRIKVSKL